MASQSLSNFQSLLASFYLRGALQAVYFQLQQARHQAITRQQPITVDFSPGSMWCIGMTDQMDCNCQQANSCLVNGLESVVSYQQFRFTELNALTFANNQQTRFSGHRGFAVGYAGSLTFTNSSQDFKVIVSNTGRVRICTLTPPVHPYKAC
ncbi:hypothetical protein BFC17_05030 [Alteromonas lipolytica]|uniref:General secretion pathway GspH domain-containing protein n=1 Tax=Alteromonas lipolytica TaxID=1856405 RepID=A0A1E8FAK9_9ALTE|nr:hypothetical protein BFC17_05030 [Alteromonas lipolytica]